MARITVEDCLENVENRFELVLLASKRARQLATTGAEPAVEWENDKPTVVALREIALGHTDFEPKDDFLDDPEITLDINMFPSGNSGTTVLFGQTPDDNQ